MNVLFIVLIGMAIWHFIYESLIAPILRKRVQYKIFEVRDLLRNTAIEGLEKNDISLYEFMDEAICHTVNIIPYLTIGNVIKAGKYRKSNSEIDNFRESLEKTNNKKLIEVDNKMAMIGGQILLINHGGWAPYATVPLAIFLLYKFLSFQMNETMKRFYSINRTLVYNDDTQSMPNNGKIKHAT